MSDQERKYQNEPEAIEVLKSITRCEEVKVQTSVTNDGQPKYSDGYIVTDNEVVFKNERGQSVHVPKERLEAENKRNPLAKLKASAAK